jgi:hypothetical protein
MYALPRYIPGYSYTSTFRTLVRNALRDQGVCLTPPEEKCTDFLDSSQEHWLKLSTGTRWPTRLFWRPSTRYIVLHLVLRICGKRKTRTRTKDEICRKQREKQEGKERKAKIFILSSRYPTGASYRLPVTSPWEGKEKKPDGFLPCRCQRQLILSQA